MAITIQELIASDTISQVVDKINFNFDQLLLNGGGPVGPAGPIGPPGPIGGRGERGTEWYEGNNDPNVVPPTVTPLQADYYLQSNGDVWEYTGLTWTNTGINLTGPAGPTGASVGWSQFGNIGGTYSATAQNVLYPSIINVGATATNEGIATAMIAAAGPNDTSVPGLTSAFKINATMAASLDASVVSMLVHQKDSSATAIRFMGGDGVDNYEQSDLNYLSNISLGTDDSLNIIVPKDATSPVSVSDTVGFTVETSYKAQTYRSGNHIELQTGTKGTATSGVDNSNFNIILNKLIGGPSPKFTLSTLSTGSQTEFISGGGITIPVIGTGSGNTYFNTGNFAIRAAITANIKGQVNSTLESGNNYTRVTPGDIDITTQGTSPIDITTQGGDITVQAGGTGDTYIHSPDLVQVGVPGASSNLIKIGDNEGISIVAEKPSLGNMGIRLLASNPGDALGIYSSTTGQIILGQTGSGVVMNPSIGIDFSGINNVMNLRNNIAWRALGDVPNTSVGSQHILISTLGVGSGAAPKQKIMSHGKLGEVLDSGIIHSAWHDNTASGIFIGKPDYGTATFPERMGFFVNNGSSFSQAASPVGAANRNPASEMFKVDEVTTKISNRLVWGGQNGVQEIEKDLFANFLLAPDIVATKPYIRIVVAPTASTTYVATNYPGLIGNPQATQEFNLNEPNEPLDGQRVHVELISISGGITLNTGMQSVPLSGGTNIKFRWVNKLVNSTTRAYSTYIETGTPAFTFIGVPYVNRVSFTLQWSGWSKPVYSQDLGNVYTNVGYPATQGWMLLGPIARINQQINNTAPSLPWRSEMGGVSRIIE